MEMKWESKLIKIGLQSENFQQQQQVDFSNLIRLENLIFSPESFISDLK